jgi:phospholipase C
VAGLLLLVGCTAVPTPRRAGLARPEIGGTQIAGSPIKHVVILFQENHSFDNVLGGFCVAPPDGHQPCDGATSGLARNGKRIPLRPQPDITPYISHTRHWALVAMDHGKMDGFNLITGCSGRRRYPCYTQSFQSQIPNLWDLAGHFVVADHIFEDYPTPSWASHMVLASSTLDGFLGESPTTSRFTSRRGPNWGCDSYRDAKWWNGHMWIDVPSCIPDRRGRGPYRASPVKYVPTIFDRLQSAGLTWKIYGGRGSVNGASGWAWSICPTFYECLGSSQRKNLVDDADVMTAAQSGTLPNLAIVTPSSLNSQHNKDSMTVGDNWIGSVVSAIEKGPEWGSTAIFITYDDCGCFYDHVPRPWPRLGIRLPFVIVSPYAKAGFTDPTVGSIDSILAYVEHNFGVSALTRNDAGAYDFSNSFDYSQPPLTGVPMVETPVPKSELAYIAAHPPSENDPT